MHRTKQRWLFFGLGMAVAATCVVLLSTLRQPQEPPAPGEEPTLPPRPAAVDAPRAAGPERETKQGESGPGAKAAVPKRTGPRVLTEEEFIDLAVKIRVWQNAIADTPEGRKRLEELVRQLLDSQDLTPSDLEAFGRRVGPEALQRIDREIARRVAELGERRITKVKPRSPAGSGAAERDTR